MCVSVAGYLGYDVLDKKLKIQIKENKMKKLLLSVLFLAGVALAGSPEMVPNVDNVIVDSWWPFPWPTGSFGQWGG